ncbi:DUF5977 domain-containing protein [Flavobacterium sp. LS1R49]|uniref:DUF5977 domain-containing protein n=1 Tax=Flavobacterium shii TaxID=2987687 RepID=A0A9X2ZG34_9FLAO|nr:DUF5977 domain-containing protein [Flavobacterium shii]MCV9928116.1 DUF5977 domain-containing protein [Flavobacterium shii]
MGNTGYKSFASLELYYIDDNSYAGTTKTNITTDPDYIAPILDTVTCTPSPRYYNTVRTLTKTKNNCSSGEIGSAVTLTANAKLFVSEISVDDANAQADSWLAASAQEYANNRGICIIPTKITFSNNVKTDLLQQMCVSFDPTGTMLYTTLHNGPDSVAQYRLSTPWDVTTATYLNKSLTINQNGESSPHGHHISPDGTKLYVGGTTSNSILYYTLSTAWDISTAVYVTFLSIPITLDYIHFSNNGIYMFLKSHGKNIQRYTLATAWDITTAALTQTLQQTSEGYDIYFKNDGTSLFTFDGNARIVTKKNLSTAWDLSSVVTTESLDISSIVALGNFESIHFSDNGLYMFIGSYFSSIYRFELNKPFDINGTLIVT